MRIFEDKNAASKYVLQIIISIVLGITIVIILIIAFGGFDELRRIVLSGITNKISNLS